MSTKTEGLVTQVSRSQIYSSLLVSFSTNPSHKETAYRAAGLQKTKGTLFIVPPSESVLKSTYNAPPRPKSRMSAGAMALCKHFERIPDSPRVKRDQAAGQIHPFWIEPRGSNDDKTRIAERILDDMLGSACWRNVMLLHRGVAVYEIRNGKGWGMRWTLDIEEMGDNDTEHVAASIVADGSPRLDDAPTETVLISNATSACTDDPTLPDMPLPPPKVVGDSVTNEIAIDPNLKNWEITKVSFRGFLEPIEGMNHELLDQDLSG